MEINYQEKIFFPYLEENKNKFSLNETKKIYETYWESDCMIIF